ncbi:MAG TPA: hypothetical protein PLR20_14890 [Syntrophales bacterium]|nr:hypothetical protein [Syntrophales bacterium]
MEKSIAFQDAKIKTLCDSQEAIFEKIDKVVEAAEKTVMEMRDTQADLRSDIRLIQIRLSKNGSGERPEKEDLELTGFLNRAWRQFLDKVGWIIIALALWAILKSFVFGEYPQLMSIFK